MSLLSFPLLQTCIVFFLHYSSPNLNHLNNTSTPKMAAPTVPRDPIATPGLDLTSASAPSTPASATANAATVPADSEAERTESGWPTLEPTHPLLRLHAKLPELIQSAGHAQIWGVTLDPATPTHSTLLILQKYLRSVANDVDAAASALGKTLSWRREYGLDGKPIWEEEFGHEFDGLGYLTHINTGASEEVVTWNLYGAVADLGKTFGNLDK